MTTSNKLWGEIDDSKPKNVPDVTADIERSMNNFCLSEFDSENEQNDSQVEHLVLDSMDPIMMYAISLHKFAAEMTETIQVAEITLDSNLTILQTDEGVPRIPEPPEIYYKHVPNNLNFIPKVKTDFTEGREVNHPELSHAVAKKILMQCVATMFAHIGYETTHSNVLLLMTEVLEDFLGKICLKMKIAHEEEANKTNGEFPHYAERVLMDLGIGYHGVHDYYQNRVLKYASVLHKRCEELVECYQKLLQPKPDDDDEEPDNKYVNKVEEEEDVVEVQMHPNVEGKAGYASLEQGFQLLNTLEAVENFAEVAEDGTPTLPNLTAAIVNDALTKIASPPFNKKKRTK